MTKTKLLSLEKRLLKEIPGLEINGRLMFMIPINSLIRGFNFEPSQYNSASFYVTMFIMPLCVPTNHIYFNFGQRIRNNNGGDRWSLEMPNLVQDLSISLKHNNNVLLSRIISLTDFVEFAKSLPVNQRALEAIGFSLARSGRISEAIEVLNQLLEKVDLEILWQRDLAEQAGILKHKLINNHYEAQEQLAIWETKTIQHLGLGEFWQKN